jgi:hypothetical protein
MGAGMGSREVPQIQLDRCRGVSFQLFLIIMPPVDDKTLKEEGLFGEDAGV